MVKTTLSSKGQVTIPREVREFLNIFPGDGVRFEIRGEDVVVKPLRRQSLESLLGSLKSSQPYVGQEAEQAAMEQAVADELIQKLRREENQ
jgi:antitoxin PrlF